MKQPNLESAYRAARRNARPLATVYFRDAEDKAAGELGAAAHALHRARGNLAAYRTAQAAIPADPADPGYRAALKAATAARALCVTYAADYGPGTWQGAAITSAAMQEGARAGDAARRARAPFQGVPPAMRNPGGRADRFPCHRAMDSRRDRGDMFAWHGESGPWQAFRDVRDAADVCELGRGHTGWITDPWGDYGPGEESLCLGVVARLSNRGNRARFVAGYRFGGHDDSGTFDMGTVYESDPLKGLDFYDSEYAVEEAAKQAARAADSLAEAAADSEREYQTASAAGSQWAEKGERLDAIRGEVRAILKERRAAPAVDLPATCRAIRDRVGTLLDERADLIRDRANLAQGDESPLIFWPGEKRLQEAFCEAAGLDAMPQ